MTKIDDIFAALQKPNLECIMEISPETPADTYFKHLTFKYASDDPRVFEVSKDEYSIYKAKRLALEHGR